MPVKRNLVLLLCAMLTLATCMTALPTMAFAADKSAIQPGVRGVALNDKVYFCTDSTRGVSWYVVGSNGVINKDSLDKKPASLFLLSEYLLSSSRFDRNDYRGFYPGSELRTKVAGIYYDNDNLSDSIRFDDKEKSAVADTTLSKNSMCKNASDLTDLAGQKLFPLSDTEASGIDASIKPTRFYGAEADAWWLRTSSLTYMADFIDGNGKDSSGTFNYGFGIRPAFNLDVSKVIFSSAANNRGQNASFAAPVAYSGTEWKLTLKDDKSFSEGASKTSGSTELKAGYSPETLVFSHAALSSLSEDYTNVTAALTNESGDILYCGSINADATATSSSVTIPAGLEPDNYTLSLYGEDRNDANKTDYASGTPFTQKITVTDTVDTPTFSPVAGTYASGQSVTLSCETADATIYYTTDGTEPTQSSTEYSEPVSLTSTTTIKAKAFKAKMTASAIAEARYTITYTVTYAANGGTGTMTPGTATSGTAFTLPACGFTAPDGKQFKEWAIGSATGTKVAAGGTYTFTEPTTAYAVWKPVTYTVTFDSNGGSTVAPVTAESGECISAPTSPTREDYDFAGWYKEAALTNLWDFSTDKVSANITLYAKWTANPPASNNAVTGIAAGQSFTSGTAMSFTAVGGGMDNNKPSNGDIRWLPVAWAVNPSGDFANGFTQSFSTTGMSLGSHTLSVTFVKQQYDGTAWTSIAPAVTDTKSVEFTLVAPKVDPKSNVPATGDNLQPMLWLGIALLAGVVLTAGTVLRRRVRKTLH